MSLTNTDDEYGAVAKAFHWVTALIVFTLIPVGLYMGTMAYGPDRLQMVMMHKSFGFLALFLVIGRIIWRIVTPAPDALSTHAPWERTLAKAAHGFLYLALLGMPLSGWIMSSAGEYPVPFFGLQMPNLVGKNESLGHLAYEVHEYLAFGLIFAIALHVAGAFKHVFIDKDATLARMAFIKSPVMPIILSVVAAGFFILVGYLVITGEEDEEETPAPAQTAQQISGEAKLEGLPAHGWAIIPSASMLEFQATMGGTPFTGKFGKFDGTIIFDPDNLAASKADITIDMTTATTGNAERDAQIGADEWFNAGQYPVARFETIAFEKGADNNYIAVGNLTIRGVTMPVTMPFTLETGVNDKGQKTALMSGRAQVNRLSYGVGQGQWAAEDTIAGDVTVAATVRALQP
jgi:cytochrome b561/polyisoprenoid-binding protein YceI